MRDRQVTTLNLHSSTPYSVCLEECAPWCSVASLLTTYFMHISHVLVEKGFLLAIFERFLQVELFPSPVFMAILRFCSILGVMELQ